MQKATDIKKIFDLFDEKAQELYKSNFSQNLRGSGVTIKGEIGKEVISNRRGPDYEAIKNFVTTFRNFILDRDSISIRNLSSIYDKLPDGNDLKNRFNNTRKKFNEYLDTNTIIEYYGEKLTNRKLIDTHLYGDVIHLEKHDEFKNWISINLMKDLIYNEIVDSLSIGGNFVFYFNNLNKEYLLTIGQDNSFP